MILYAVVLLDINFQLDEINSVTVFPVLTPQEALDKGAELRKLYPYNDITYHSMDTDTGETIDATEAELRATAS